VGHASRSSGLLHLRASRARVSQSSLKISGGTMAVGACGTITEVVLESSRRWTGQCDGLCRTLLPLLYYFLCIRPYGYSSLFLGSINRTLKGWGYLTLLLAFICNS
jgi:hypothetical protein